MGRCVGEVFVNRASRTKSSLPARPHRGFLNSNPETTPRRARNRRHLNGAAVAGDRLAADTTRHTSPPEDRLEVDTSATATTSAIRPITARLAFRFQDEDRRV